MTSISLTPKGLVLAWAMFDDGIGRTREEMVAKFTRETPDELNAALNELVADGNVRIDEHGRIAWASLRGRDDQ